MASSGTINGTVQYQSVHYSFRLVWAIISRNTSLMTSDVRVQAYITRAPDSGATFDTGVSRAHELSIVEVKDNWSQRYNHNPWPPSADVLLRSFTTTVWHYSNGTRNDVTIAGNLNLTDGTIGPGICQASAVVSLDAFAVSDPTPLIRVRAGGSWRTATALQVRMGGSWRTATGIWTRVNGTWRQGV